MQYRRSRRLIHERIACRHELARVKKYKCARLPDL